MFIRTLCWLAFAVALLASPARAEPSTMWKTCTGNTDVDWQLQIKSCTAIIASKDTVPADLARAYRSRGIAFLELTFDRPVSETGDDLKRAFADLDMAIKLDPKHAAAFYYRGIAWYSSGVVRNAITDFTEAIRLNPNLAAAYFERARAYLMLGDEARSVADYTEMIRIDPDDVEAYRARGQALETLGEHQRAISDYTEAIRLEPKFAPTYADRGKLLSVIGELDRAHVDLTEAIGLEPNNGAHHANRGFVRFYQGDFAASAPDLQRAVELKPEGILSLHALVFRYLARRRAGEDGDAELATHVAQYRYPVAAIEFLLGRGSLETAQNEAPSPRQRCELEFYIGERHLIRRERDAARTHLQAAADAKCRYVNPHHLAAVAELKRMGP